MTVFDGSTSQAVAYEERPEIEAPQPAEDSMDTLSLLRDMVEEQASETLEPKIIEVPGGRFRMHCSIDISANDLKKWQLRGVRADKRKSGKFTPADVDQFLYNATLLAHTLLCLDVKTKHGWVTVTDKHSGEPLTLLDGLPTVLGVMDSTSAVRKLFRRDSDLLRACSEIRVAAGWEEGEGDDAEDPTD